MLTTVKSAFVIKANILQFQFQFQILNQSSQSFTFEYLLIISIKPSSLMCCNNFNVGFVYLRVFKFSYSRMMACSLLNVFNLLDILLLSGFPLNSLIMGFNSPVLETPFGLHSSSGSSPIFLVLKRILNLF